MSRQRFGRVVCRFAAWCGAIVAPSTAHAHGAPLDQRVHWGDWNLDPVILMVLALIAWLYARGVTRIWRRARVGAVVGCWHVAAFAAGMAALAVALVSPLDPLSDQLAWVHMVQHMVLMTVAAPLIMLGVPALVLLWGLPLDSRQLLARWWCNCRVLRVASQLLWAPLLLFGLYWLVTWGWHVPAWYDEAVRDPFIHDMQHISFFVAACLFWRVLLDPISRRRVASPAAVIYLFGATLHAAILGALMTLAPTAWYTAYEERTTLWGLTPLEDQQLAGLIMWMPACAAYLVAAVVLIGSTFVDRDVRQKRPTAARDSGNGRPALPALSLELRSLG